MKMILDLDTGIDDALAIAYALGRSEIDLIGITTLFGNVTVEDAVTNSLAILELLGRKDIPVAEGAHCPSTKSTYQTSALSKRIHGINGIGNIQLSPPKRVKEKIDAVDFLIEAANKYGEELTLVATGPMTNLANAIRKNRYAIEKIGKIVIMGGALTVIGNCNRFAEANIYQDPAAAKEVFESGIALTMVGLDVTLKTMLTDSDINLWKQIETEASKQFVEMSTYYYSNEHSNSDIIGGAMHDPLAVEVAINSDIATITIPINLTVETEGESAGRTIADMTKLNLPEKSITVCIEVDGESFVEKFTNTVKSVLT